jgi:hypothetical protein
LICTAIHLLLSKGLYVQAFEGWNLLAEVNQTWIKLRRIIQEAFQWHLNVTAPTVGCQGYAPALPYMMNNAFGALGPTRGGDNDDNSCGHCCHLGGPLLTMQSQLTASTVENMMQQQDNLYKQLAQQQTLLHANQHQIFGPVGRPHVECQ